MTKPLPKAAEPYKLKKGDVLNPTGMNQYTGKQRFLAAVEAELSKQFAKGDVAAELAKRLVKGALAGGKQRKFVAERLWDKVSKVEVAAKIVVTDEARAEAQRKLDKLLARKET